MPKQKANIFKKRGDRKYDDVWSQKWKKLFSTYKQYLNMHRHESNCKYDITMFFDDDMLAGMFVPEKKALGEPSTFT